MLFCMAFADVAFKFLTPVFDMVIRGHVMAICSYTEREILSGFIQTQMKVEILNSFFYLKNICDIFCQYCESYQRSY